MRRLLVGAWPEVGYLPLATGRSWADVSRKRSSHAWLALPAALQTLLPAIALILIGVALGWVLPSRNTPVLMVASSPLFPVDLSYLKDHPYDPIPDRVANSRNLNFEQCEHAFPLLWSDVRKTAKQFERKGITLAELDRRETDETRVAVVDRQLYVKTYHGESTTRSLAVLASLREAIMSSPDDFPDVEFVFRATDSLDSGAHFGLTKQDSDKMWLLPDFGLWSWPEPRVLGWQDARRKAIEAEQGLNWTIKEDKLFWRGAYLSQLRHDLRDAANPHPWGDIGEINWGNGAAGRISMEDHCKKRFLADADSHSYSGRLKYLFLCRSVVVSHRKRWRQHWHGALDGRAGSPTQNWVELEHENWDGLVGAVEDLRKDESRAEEIAENAVRAFRDRYLTPASTACYWRRVLAVRFHCLPLIEVELTLSTLRLRPQEYAALQRFTPTRGGIDFESFILAREVDYAPH
ncbi:hypothetical protein JCM3770_000828 [Rhodotorula araucariae]